MVRVVWCVGPLGTAMRVRVLHAKLYAYALPGSTARQLFISSTLLDSSTARQLLDRPRQTSTDLDKTRRTGTWSQPRQARQGSTGKRPRQQARQRLDGASTARQLNSQGSNPVRLIGFALVPSRLLFGGMCPRYIFIGMYRCVDSAMLG